MFLDCLTSVLPLAQAAVETTVTDSSASRVVSAQGMENLIPIVAIIVGCIIAVVGIIAGVVSHGQREKTRREIAAYVAEGSINPEDGERMMRAASSTKCGKG
ncbi:MAG: hypothetical protein ACIAQF_11630 [Phycisphaerales bacterium JB065]